MRMFVGKNGILGAIVDDAGEALGEGRRRL